MAEPLAWQVGRPIGPRSCRLSARVALVVSPSMSPMMTLEGTNTYVLAAPDARGAVVIDPGPPDQEHAVRVARAAGGRRVELVLLTHTHVDHAERARAGRREGAGRRRGPARSAADPWALGRSLLLLAGGGARHVHRRPRPGSRQHRGRVARRGHAGVPRLARGGAPLRAEAPLPRTWPGGRRPRGEAPGVHRPSAPARVPGAGGAGGWRPHSGRDRRACLRWRGPGPASGRGALRQRPPGQAGP